MKQNKIYIHSWKDLNTGLKWAIVGGYAALISFAIGFIDGIFALGVY